MSYNSPTAARLTFFMRDRRPFAFRWVALSLTTLAFAACTEVDPPGSRDDFADAGQTVDAAVVDTQDTSLPPDIEKKGCTDDSQCEPAGVCDAELGECVDCRTDQDCPQSAFCIEGQCIPDICVPGETRCYTVKNVAMCKANGGGWNLSACPSETFCEDGKCVPFNCSPGSLVCDKANVMKCDADGVAYVFDEDCTKTNQACVSGACVPKGCTAGSIKCTQGTSGDTALICKDPQVGIESQSCADTDPCTYDRCQAGVGCSNPPKPDGIACGKDKWCHGGQCTQRTANLSIIFDTSGSMSFKVPGKLCWQETWPDCLQPHKQCSRMGVAKNVFVKALQHLDPKETRMSMFRFPQLVLDPKAKTSPKPPYFKPPEVTCRIGNYMGYQDMTDHTIEQSVNSGSSWYWNNLNEILCAPYPEKDLDDPRIEMNRWMDGKEEYLVEPELRSIGGTPIGKTLFYVGEYLRNVVVVDGKKCAVTADCKNPNYLCEKGTCHDPMRACRDTTVVIFTDGGEVNKPNQFFSPWVQAKRLAYGLQCATDDDCVGGAKCRCPADNPACKPALKQCDPDEQGTGYYCRTTMKPCLPEAQVGQVGFCPQLQGFDACAKDPIGEVTAIADDPLNNVLRSPDGKPFSVKVHVVDISERPWGIDKSANIARSGNGLLLASTGQDEDTFLKYLLTAFDAGPKPACGAKNITCTGKDPAECDDSDPCTQDECSNITKTCVHKASNGPCDDGDPCTLGERCLGGKCKAGIVHIGALAGSGSSEVADGNAGKSSFQTPRAVESDGQGGVFIGDHHTVRHLSKSGAVTTLAGGLSAGLKDEIGADAKFHEVYGLSHDAAGQRLFVADRVNHRIRALDLKTKQVNTHAGLFKGFKEGPAAEARFNLPEDVLAAPAGGKTVVFVADRGNRRIRKIDGDGTVTTAVGTGIAGLIDGPVATARLGSPAAIAIDGSGAIFIADSHRVRKLANGLLTTIAGGDVGFKNGVGENARFHGMSGIAVAVDGTLFVTDAGNHRIRKVTKDGAATTLVGGYDPGYQNGFGSIGQLDKPSKLALLDGGKLVVADTGNWRLRLVQLPDVACPTGGECNASYCEEKTGKCATKPAADGTPCEGEACLEGQTCTGLKCVAGTPKACDDQDVCTDDSCAPSNGGCLHTPNTASCDDGEACTEDDKCSEGACVGNAQDCDDGETSTSDVCYLGKCYHQAAACETDQDCSDGEATCTVDSCINQKCQYAPTGAAGCCESTPWKNDFETVDLKGIQITNSGGPTKGWQLWDKPGDPPLKALYYGDSTKENYVFDGPNSGYFVLPEVELPAGRGAWLGLWLWMQTEGGKLFDALRIEVYGPKGSTVLWEKTAALSLASWSQLKLPLTAWAGQKISVRITFETIDDLKNDGFGVLVDNLAVEVECASK